MTAFDIPAICQNCGLVFPSGIGVKLYSQVQTHGGGSRCPRCKEGASIPDQIIRVIENGIQVFKADDFTIDVLRALNIAVEDLRSGKKPTPAIIGQLHKSSPSIANEFRQWANLGVNIVIAMAAVATAVFTWMQTPGQNRTVDEVAIDALESMYQEPQPIISQGLRLPGVAPYEHNNYPHKSNRKTRRAEGAKKRRKIR
ncbi:hypothetical protein [Sulfitobacter pontiacus]|uniref:hypothetical protein n=1 Tax=Sulfitobacter pontiacus TaxID=60137 RepID=UPI00295F2F7E|nr:hypothetical protein [Sulfitobacter pontiacus]